PDETKAIVHGVSPIGLYDVGERFGTIGVVMPGDDAGAITVEITTFRSERYDAGSRHPVVAYGASIDDDLARRDFTVNAIAVDTVDGALHDPFHGQADLAMGMLRAVGDPVARFREDPLRLLRAARFVAQLGFSVEPGTRAALASEASLLSSISNERVLMELTRLLCGEYAGHGLELLLETGLLTIAMPELVPLERAAFGHPGDHREKDLWEHTKRVVTQTPPRPAVRWAALLHDAAKPLTRSVDATGEVHFFGHERVGASIAGKVLGRLNADKQTRKAVHRLVELHLRPASYDIATWTDSAVRRLALEAGEVLHDLLDLAAADVTSARAHRQRAAADRVQGLRDHLARLEQEVELDRLQSPLDGDALMALFDRPPGRWIAGIKDHLREMVIDGELEPGDTATAARIAGEFVARLDTP
ncbi:MAG: HD domain-containing protein, partial [Chloroflexia bacterium]|nr:HD domain-containing protein [Chloroflexia bacterium]